MRVPKKLIVLLCGAAAFCGTALPSTAQAVVPPTPPPAADTPLVIPSPPGATLQMEMDLSDDDLLGVFKSLLKGVGDAANNVPSVPLTAQSPQKGVTDAQIAAVLSNADLSDVFKGVTHLHFEMLQFPAAAPPPVPVAPGHAKMKANVMPQMPDTPDQTSFYETAFATEGGHRIIYSNYPPIHLLMTSFGHAHGFALMVQSPGSIAVFRSDGYPDLSKLSALATSIGAVVGKAAVNAHTKTTPTP